MCAVRTFDFIVGPETSTSPTQGVLPSVLVATKSANYTVTDSDGIGTIFVDDTSSNRTITLPTAADNTDRVLTIINTSSDGGTVTVEGEGAETVDGQLNQVIYRQYDGVQIQCDGSSWYSLEDSPSQIIQDFTTISSVGSSNQQYAGHHFDTDEGGTGTDIAYYKFASGAMTTDEEGAYTLTDHGTVPNTTGIFNTNYAASFDGSSQWFTQATVLDVTPASIVIDFWMKADDGQPAAQQFLFIKHNVSNQDTIYCSLETNGNLKFFTEENNNGDISIYSSTKFPNTATDWTYVVCAWDTTYGKRFWINGVLEASDSTATTLMGNGTDLDLGIGATPAGALYFDGKIALFRVRNQVLTQKDVDLGYSYKYDLPDILQDTNFTIDSYIQKDGSSSYERSYDFEGLEVKRTSSNLYRAGGVITGLGSTDKLKILGRR